MLNQLAGIIFSETFVFSIFRITTPILFAALAAVIADRAGVTNIGLEGIMMICALTGVIFSAKLQSAWLGLLFAILLGVLTALMIGFFALKLKTDIILAGIAVNMLGNGGTIFVMFLVSGDRGYSANLASKVMPTVNIPILQDIPILGKILSGHNILTYFAFICVLLVWTPDPGGGRKPQRRRFGGRQRQPHQVHRPGPFRRPGWHGRRLHVHGLYVQL